MPGFDGTGPRGQGPMTGKSGGFCLLNIPDSNSEPQSGFAGLAGDPVSLANDCRQADCAWLRERLREIETQLYNLKWRVANLENCRSQHARETSS